MDLSETFGIVRQALDPRPLLHTKDVQKIRKSFLTPRFYKAAALELSDSTIKRLNKKFEELSNNLPPNALENIRIGCSYDLTKGIKEVKLNWMAHPAEIGMEENTDITIYSNSAHKVLDVFCQAVSGVFTKNFSVSYFHEPASNIHNHKGCPLFATLPLGKTELTTEMPGIFGRRSAPENSALIFTGDFYHAGNPDRPCLIALMN